LGSAETTRPLAGGLVQMAPHKPRVQRAYKTRLEQVWL